MDITGTPTFRFERSQKMKLRMKSMVAGLVIIIVIMLAYICTLPSVQPRDDDNTNLRWLQKIIDENVKKKIEMKNSYKPSISSNRAYPEKTKLKLVDDRAWWTTTTPDNSELTTFDLFDSKSKSISSNSKSSMVETSKHRSDKTIIKNKLKKFDLPFDIFGETASTTLSTTSTWEPFQKNRQSLGHAFIENQLRKLNIPTFHDTFGATLTTTRPITRYPARYPKFPKLAASTIARSFSNRLSDTDNTDTNSNKRNPNETIEGISKSTSINGYAEKNRLFSSKNEENPLKAPNNLLSSKNEKNSFKTPTYNQINIRKQTDQSNFRKIPFLETGFRPDKESHTDYQIDEDNPFPPHHATPTNTIGEQTANNLAQMRPNIGNDVDNKLRDYKQSLLEKTLDTGKGLGATNEVISPRSPVSKSAIPAEKIETFSIQSLPKIGTVGGHKIKDKVTETSGSIHNNQNNPDSGILQTIKEKTNKSIDKLQTDGLIKNITMVRNSRIKICNSDTTTKP